MPLDQTFKVDLELDVLEKRVQRDVYTVQKDANRILKVTFVDYDIGTNTPAYARIVCTKPDGNVTDNQCEVHYKTANEAGFIIAPVSEQTLAVKGDVKCQIKMVSSFDLTSDTEIVTGKSYYTRSGSAGAYVFARVLEPKASQLNTYYEANVQASSFTFVIHNMQSTDDDSIIVSTSEGIQLIELLEHTAEAISGCETATQNANSAVQRCETAIGACETAVQNCNDKIDECEETRQACEDATDDLADVKQDCITATQNAETATQSAVSATNASVVATQNANNATTRANNAVEDVAEAIENLEAGVYDRGGITIDAGLDKNSTNPVQNKAIAEALEDVVEFNKIVDNLNDADEFKVYRTKSIIGTITTSTILPTATQFAEQAIMDFYKIDGAFLADTIKTYGAKVNNAYASNAVFGNLACIDLENDFGLNGMTGLDAFFEYLGLDPTKTASDLVINDTGDPLTSTYRFTQKTLIIPLYLNKEEVGRVTVSYRQYVQAQGVGVTARTLLSQARVEYNVEPYTETVQKQLKTASCIELTSNVPRAYVLYEPTESVTESTPELY